MAEQGDATLNICFCFTDGSGSYYRHPLVALCSVFENTKARVRAHILCDESVAEPTREAFAALAKRYEQEVVFYDVPDIAQTVLANVPVHFGKGTLYRLFLPELVHESLVLYMDCDIICTMNICEIFSINVGKIPVAGAVDIGQLDNEKDLRRQKELGFDPECYINAGVMLCNLDMLRKDYPDYAEAAFADIAEKQYKYADQDALNFYFQKKGLNIAALPESYNFLLGVRDCAWLAPSEYSGKILHYVRDKPWKALFPAAMEYWKYYSLAFSCQSAFAEIAKLGCHEYTHLYTFLLRNPWMRRIVGRAWQVEQEGIVETLLDRIFPRRRKQKNKERRKGV